jgi:hypothetical protein
MSEDFKKFRDGSKTDQILYGLPDTKLLPSKIDTVGKGRHEITLDYPTIKEYIRQSSHINRQGELLNFEITGVYPRHDQEHIIVEFRRTDP